MIQVHTNQQEKALYPLIPQKRRVLIWEKARGMLKEKHRDAVKELKKIRKEWDRKLEK